MDALFYVSDGGWGTGLHRPLHDFEFDGNNWTIAQAIAALEAAIPSAAVGITSITPSGSALLVTYSDSTTQSVDISSAVEAVASINLIGPFAGLTVYHKFTDLFTANGALYQVIFDHTSAASFDPGANDGSGHNYYNKVLDFPATAVMTRAGSTFTFTTSDGNTYNRFTNAGGCAITITDADFPTDTEITCAVKGNGPVTVAGETTNVVIEVPFGFSAAAAIKGAIFGLKYVGNNGGIKTWDMFGLLSPGGIILAGLHIDSDTFHAPTVS